ncbi:hypothetical protein K4G96_21815, partial [Mycobacterium tuberculosis]|nr:hypothetical protein [Mycobacterium tuberculosis]
RLGLRRPPGRYSAGSDLAERGRHLLDGQPVDPGERQNVDGALKLINFLLRPDVAKQVAETIGYPTPNLAARKMLSPAVANDKSLFLDAAATAESYTENVVGSAIGVYESAWPRAGQVDLGVF